jgi:hypothetical protein
MERDENRSKASDFYSPYDPKSDGFESYISSDSTTSIASPPNTSGEGISWPQYEGPSNSIASESDIKSVPSSLTCQVAGSEVPIMESARVTQSILLSNTELSSRTHDPMDSIDEIWFNLYLEDRAQPQGSTRVISAKI